MRWFLSYENDPFLSLLELSARYNLNSASARDLRDEKEHSKHDAIEYISITFGLTDEEKRAVLPSGQMRINDNRVGWARTYLKKALLLESPRRAYMKITSRGLQLLANSPPKISDEVLLQYPEFRAFKMPGTVEQTRKQGENETLSQSETPDELIETGYTQIRKDLAQELLAVAASALVALALQLRLSY
ncbi:winged helix-turn-helix domain-containing protein [Candidatus Bathyarchaeota archaeon]|nr:winged helix-turn-helix domain-containing protein [Candidatus Bathyarchaeota archaeon]